ncbi:MAG: hypothetical protein JF600_02830 [Xanthomonadales bacterium]|nr:hypothetical protein [Xanthomonadales bacterium]
MQDFSFQGKLYLGNRLPGGRPGALRWVGDAPKCDLTLKTETETRKESYSGNRLTSAVLQKGKEAELTVAINWADIDNLLLGLYASKASIAAGTVTGEAFPAGLAPNDVIALDHTTISQFVLTDGNAAPATLVANTHYRIESIRAGLIKLLNLATFVQPLRAAYRYGARTSVAMLTTSAPERFLYLDGTNSIDNAPVQVRLYRVQFNPVSNLGLINESFGQFELTASVLFDAEAAADPLLGGFGRLDLPEVV